MSRNQKDSKRAAIARLIRSIPEANSIFDILVGLGTDFWENDPNRDRTAAIMGASFIEYALKTSICRHLKPDESDPEFKFLFEKDDAPYREFSSRNRLARALGVIDRADFEQLEAIRLIRNAFAHTMLPISFQTPEIAIYFDDLTILDDSEGFKILVDFFAAKTTLLGMLPSSRAHRVSFAHAVFLFYWKLTTDHKTLPYQ